MAHKIQCRCGKTLLIPDRFAGRKVRCVTCEQVLRLDETTVERPPGDYQKDCVTCQICKVSYPAMTRICLPCGVNLKTGAVVYSPRDVSSEELDWSSEENLLKRSDMVKKLHEHLMDQ